MVGGWSRSTAYFGDDSRDASHPVPTDGLWVITLGTKGSVGLILFYLALVLPAILFLWRFPATMWRVPSVGLAALAATLLGLYMIDCTVNGFVNIIYVTLAGAIIGMTPAQRGVSVDRKHGAKILNRQSNCVSSRTTIVAQPSLDRANDRQSHAFPPSDSKAIVMAERYQSLGRTLKSAGRFPEAQVAWRQALDILTRLTALHPDASDLQRRWCDCANDLAWLLLSHPDPDSRDPALALTLASRVVQKCSDSSVYWNTLGVAYFRTGDFGSAVSALDRAIAVDGEGNSFDHILLAMAHARLGNREESRQYLAQAMFQKERDYPSHPELARFCDEAHSIITAGPDPQAVVL